MSKTLGFYRDGIRELREAGFDAYSASNGYALRGDLSSGQKGAISRALGALENERAEIEERLEESTEADWWNDSHDDADWDDIDYFDYENLEDFVDEEADSYEEGEAK